MCLPSSLVLGASLAELTRVLESIKAGKRMPEAQFSNLKIAAKGQQSVYGMFKKVEGLDSTAT